MPKIKGIKDVTFKDFLNDYGYDFRRVVEKINESPSCVTSVKRLHSCSAEVLTLTNWYALRSYSTIVAIINRNDNCVYVGGYYSATTQQHIAKFIGDYVEDFRYTRINLYIPSTRVVRLTPCGHKVWKVSAQGYLYLKNSTTDTNTYLYWSGKGGDK